MLIFNPQQEHPPPLVTRPLVAILALVMAVSLVFLLQEDLLADFCQHCFPELLLFDIADRSTNENGLIYRLGTIADTDTKKVISRTRLTG